VEPYVGGGRGLRFWKEIDLGAYCVGRLNEENPIANCWTITLWYKVDPYYHEEYDHFLELHGLARGCAVIKLDAEKHSDVIAKIKRVVEEKPAEEAFQELSKIAFETAPSKLKAEITKILAQ
jgi:hypothetical protein